MDVLERLDARLDLLRPGFRPLHDAEVAAARAAYLGRAGAIGVARRAAAARRAGTP